MLPWDIPSTFNRASFHECFAYIFAWGIPTIGFLTEMQLQIQSAIPEKMNGLFWNTDKWFQRIFNPDRQHRNAFQNVTLSLTQKSYTYNSSSVTLQVLKLDGNYRIYLLSATLAINNVMRGNVVYEVSQDGFVTDSCRKEFPRQALAGWAEAIEIFNDSSQHLRHSTLLNDTHSIVAISKIVIINAYKQPLTLYTFRRKYMGCISQVKFGICTKKMDEVHMTLLLEL